MSGVINSRWPQTLAAVAGLIMGAATAPALAAGSVENGLALAGQWCNSCHIINEAAAVGMEAEVGPAFMEIELSGPTDLQGELAEPHPFMPHFSDFTDQDYEDLYAFIQSVAND